MGLFESAIHFPLLASALDAGIRAHLRLELGRTFCAQFGKTLLSTASLAPTQGVLPALAELSVIGTAASQQSHTFASQHSSPPSTLAMFTWPPTWRLTWPPTPADGTTYAALSAIFLLVCLLLWCPCYLTMKRRRNDQKQWQALIRKHGTACKAQGDAVSDRGRVAPLASAAEPLLIVSQLDRGSTVAAKGGSDNQFEGWWW